MRNKIAKQLRKAVRIRQISWPKIPAEAYEVVPHTVRRKEYREPWQTKDEPPKATYTTATLRLVSGCFRERYQEAKRIYKQAA